MSFPVGLATGLLAWPTAVLVAVAVEAVREGGWVGHLDACRHDGPHRRDVRWRATWRCPELYDGDAGPACRALWVRDYVYRAVPNRVLWPREVRAMRAASAATGAVR